MNENNEKRFIAYEYFSTPVKQDMETVYIDCYKNFGWILESSVLNIANINSINLKFKRDRRIKNKTELSELQRKCENALIAIQHLERSKTSSATIAALIIGVLGTAFLVGAVFSFLAKQIPLFVLLGVAGLIGCTLSYFTSIKVQEKKTLEVAPLIDQQYEIIYDTCEEASKLLV